MAISYLKKTYKDVVIKVAGNNILDVIELSDLLAQSEYFDDNPLTVNIIGIAWTGHYNTTITISRNNKIILSLPSVGSNYIDFCMDNLARDDTNNQSNISVNISGGQGEVWIKCKKVMGYRLVSLDINNGISNASWDNTLNWDTGLIWA